MNPGLKAALLTGAAFILAGMGSPAFAQTSKTAAASAPEIGEVVVTGQRRESTVQNTAAAIDVISAEDLAATGTDATMELQFATPGLTISQDLSLQTQIFIRGIGSNLQGIATGNSVATYVDGVFIPNSIQASQNFTDIERVEVLKGPQATLYGRNATGGALVIVSSEPKFDDFNGAAEVSYGTWDSYGSKFRINVPLVEDKLAFSLATQTSSHGGYARNLFTGNELAYEDTKGVRGALRWRPIDTLDLILRADYTEIEASDVYKLRPGTTQYYITADGRNWFIDDPRKVYYDVDNRNPGYDRGVSLTARWDTPIGLINSVTSRRLFDAGPIIADSDQTPSFPVSFGVKINTIGSRQQSDSIYNDTYLTHDFGDVASLIVGGNYFLDKGFDRTRGTTTRSDANARTEAWSIYTDGYYNVTDTVRLVAGVRYSDEEKRYDYRVLPAGAIVRNNKTFTSTNPRFGIEWRPEEGLLLYATATSGFKSGGFNQTNPLDDFQPEKVWAYEGGVKTRLFDRRARVAASAFYYDYTDIQVLQYVVELVNGVSMLRPNITNGGQATIYGLDLDGDFAVTENLTVGAGVSLLHTEFGSAIFCDPFYGACPNANGANNVNVEGNSLARAPEVTGNLYGEYIVPLPFPGQLKVRLNAAYRSRTFFTVFENKLHSEGAYWLLGGNIRYDSPTNWYAELYGSNLTDELAITNIINTSPNFVFRPGQAWGTAGNFERYAAPRTLGMRVGVKF